MLIPRLQAVHNPEHLGRIPPRARRIAHDQSDHLLRIHDEHTPNRKRNPLGIHIGCILMIQHIVQIRHFPLLVADDGKLELRPADLVDVFDPPTVRLDRVGRQPDQLDAAPRELGL